MLSRDTSQHFKPSPQIQYRTLKPLLQEQSMAPQVDLAALPEGIFSLLDTDLYKLTMQCAVLKYLPTIREYAHNRLKLCMH